MAFPLLLALVLNFTRGKDVGSHRTLISCHLQHPQVSPFLCFDATRMPLASEGFTLQTNTSPKGQRFRSTHSSPDSVFSLPTNHDRFRTRQQMRKSFSKMVQPSTSIEQATHHYTKRNSLYASIVTTNLSGHILLSN